MILKVKRLRPDAKLPEYANEGDAGADLFSVEDMVIEPGHRALVPTGIAVELEKNTEAQVRSKSGIALKNGVMVLNSPGTVDEGYRGEVGVILFNTSNENFIIKAGQKIAQLVVKPVYQAKVMEIHEFSSETDRGEGGFGSTGI